MTREDIIQMAREAGAEETMDGYFPFFIEELERFAQLVAEHVRSLEWLARRTNAAIAAEREACATVCVDLAADYITAGHPANEISARAAAIGATRIRARGQA